jgi:ribosomal protein L28
MSKLPSRRVLISHPLVLGSGTRYLSLELLLGLLSSKLTSLRSHFAWHCDVNSRMKQLEMKAAKYFSKLCVGLQYKYRAKLRFLAILSRIPRNRSQAIASVAILIRGTSSANLRVILPRQVSEARRRTRSKTHVNLVNLQYAIRSTNIKLDMGVSAPAPTCVLPVLIGRSHENQDKNNAIAFLASAPKPQSVIWMK